MILEGDTNVDRKSQDRGYKLRHVAYNASPLDVSRRMVANVVSKECHVPIATEMEERVRNRVARSSSCIRERRRRLPTLEVNPESLIAFIEPRIEVVIPEKISIARLVLLKHKACRKVLPILACTFSIHRS